MNETIVLSLQNVAARIQRCSEPSLVLASVHTLWLLVVGEEHGASWHGLQALAQDFRDAPLEGEAGAAVKLVAEGAARLRCYEYEAATKCFAVALAHDEIPTALKLGAACWESVALSLRGCVRKAQEPLKVAKELAADVKPAQPALNGLIAYADALAAYKRGEHSRALEQLEEQRLAFRSATNPERVDLPMFEAEQLLLKAKTLRELGLYQRSLRALAQAQALRQRTRDLMGYIWGALEQGRIHRFLRDYKAAAAALDEAECRLVRTDFTALRARVLDQRGDVYRHEGKLDEAERCYRQAMALIEGTGHERLHAHFGNSLARLLEQRGRGQEALDILEKYQRHWQDAKSRAKHLYLCGTIHATLGDKAQAERMLTKAIALLRRNGVKAYEALALARLAEIRLAQGQKEEAVQAWIEALQIAPQVEAEQFVERIQEQVNKLRASDLLPMIAALTNEKHRAERAFSAWKDAEEKAGERHWMERFLLAHRFAYPVHRCLQSAESLVSYRTGFLRGFCNLLSESDWCAARFCRRPAQPVVPTDVAALVRMAAETASRLVKSSLQVVVPKTLLIPVNAHYLGKALTALMSGAHTAWGTKEFRCRFPSGSSSDYPCVILVELAAPAPDNMTVAENLARLECEEDEEVQRHFIQKGYNGDLILMDFIIRIALWGKVCYTDKPPAIRIELPAERTETTGGPT